jgi:hypothetical protein
MTKAIFGTPGVRTTKPPPEDKPAAFERWQQRVLDERDELGQRLLKLREFLATANLHLPEVERQDLNDQATHMGGYLVILDRRIARFTTNEGKT